ncbi:MAG: helix-turn-helix transcriptional regulator [Serratia grimesii]|uniref:helix-turn-helix transcriptional regulator n=1 Tax=Serratia grimesii TaxID=82995 RepID=UPI003F9D5318
MNANCLFYGDGQEMDRTEDREMAYERLIFNTTEDIFLALEDAGMTQKDLACKMGKSRSHISQLLDGTRNMTLKTLSDIAYAIGVVSKVKILKDGVDVSHPIIPERSKYEFSGADIREDVKPVVRIKITVGQDAWSSINAGQI